MQHQLQILELVYIEIFQLCQNREQSALELLREILSHKGLLRIVRRLTRMYSTLLFLLCLLELTRSSVATASRSN